MIRLRDWWRGYTDADVASAREKLAFEYELGAAVGLTPGERRAVVAVRLASNRRD